MLSMARIIRTALPSRALLRPKGPNVPTAANFTPVVPSMCAAPRALLHTTQAAATEETFTYQAEVDRLMDMIVNSLYSNKEVFLRELVSNASDALDKIRIQSLTDSNAYSTGTDLEIRIKADKEAKTITIEDTGIGMTKDDLMSSLGTIARSGTRKFAEAMKQAQDNQDNDLIGQFGVGFYSSFLVADRVRVQTKNNDDSQWIWESEAGSHQFTIKEDPANDLSRGTRVTLFVKEDDEDMLEEANLRRLIKQYSEFINFDIKLWSKDRVPKQVEDVEATKKAQEEADKKAKEEGKEEAEKVEPVMKTDYDEVEAFKVQNENKPIWLRSPKEVKKEEYESFFKQTFKEYMEPMTYTHFRVEGTFEFTGLVFIPGMAPFDRMRDGPEKPKPVRLFVKRVFISDTFGEQLLPQWLHFVKGVVDSSDLPLNVSREILQESRVSRVIRKQLVKRTVDMMLDFMKENSGGEEDKYSQFWEQFGRDIKLGIVEDTENRPKLAKLLRFKSSKSGEVMTSLEDYVSRMKEGQKGIFYIPAESDKLAANSPFTEALAKKDVEVLYFTEPIDEWCATNMTEFDGKKLVDISKEGLEVDEDDKNKVEAAQKELQPVIDFLKGHLTPKIKDVRVSVRLTDSPCVLVASQYGWSANMQRIMKSQPMQDAQMAEYMRADSIMELNPENRVVRTLNDIVTANKDDARAKEIATLLYDTATLTSGFTVDSPVDYAAKVYDMIGLALSSDGTSDDGKSSKAGKSKDVEADVVIEPKE